MLLPSKDGGYVYTRTMQFTLQMQSQIMILPRGQKMVCTGTYGVAGKGGLRWTAKYAAAGANALGLFIIIDGLNEKGLSGALFNFPGYAQFQKVRRPPSGPRPPTCRRCGTTSGPAIIRTSASSTSAMRYRPRRPSSLSRSTSPRSSGTSRPDPVGGNHASTCGITRRSTTPVRRWSSPPWKNFNRVWSNPIR
ncbi:MAG: linear amide C-N hydrolase [Limisphaerales bacterium]